jgi:hypothetical protein
MVQIAIHENEENIMFNSLSAMDGHDRPLKN